MKINKKVVSVIAAVSFGIAMAGYKTLDLFNQLKDMDLKDPFEVDIDDE